MSLAFLLLIAFFYSVFVRVRGGCKGNVFCVSDDIYKSAQSRYACNN